MSDRAPTETAVSLREGARRLGVSTRRFVKIAAAAPIRRVELPGVTARYLVADLVEVASRAIKSGPRPERGE